MQPNFIKTMMTYTESMTVKQKKQLVVYTAEQTLPLFKQSYPFDKRPLKAIEAAKAAIKKDTKENRKKLYTTAYASYNAYVSSASYSAYCAYAAALFVYNSSNTVFSSIDSANEVFDIAKLAMQSNLIKYAVKLLKEKKDV